MPDLAKQEVLTRDDRAKLLAFARASIRARLRRMPPPDFAPGSKACELRRGVFVTLTNGGKLRGCIGTVQPVRALYRAVQEAALSAALDDLRFPPVTSAELPEIRIEISVILPPRRICSHAEIEVSRHGLILEHQGARAVLLPQVAERNNWDRETFLERLCIKADLARNAWQAHDLNLMVFEAEIFHE